MPRAAVVALGAALLVVALAVPAWAHTEFEESTLLASSEEEVHIIVEDHRDDAENARIEIAVPDGFVPLECAEEPQWACMITEPRGGDPAVVIFERALGVPAEVEEDDTWQFTVATPSASGTYLFPVIQVYDDGQEVRWVDEDEDDEHPAPRLDVTVGADGEPTEPEPTSTGAGPSPTSSPSPSPTASPTASPTSSPSPSPDPTPTATVTQTPTATESPTISETPTATPTPTPTKATAEPTPTKPDATGTPDDLEVDVSDGGGSGRVIAIVAAVVLLGAIAGTAVYLRRPSGGPPPAP